MATTMTSDRWRAFVSEGTRTGKLATVRGDGSPHLAPVWFLLDGDDLVFTTGEATVKGRNLARDGRVAVCVDDERPPFAMAVLRGRAELTGDLEQVRSWATRIAARSMGEERAEERAEEYGARNGVPGNCWCVCTWSTSSVWTPSPTEPAGPCRPGGVRLRRCAVPRRRVTP